MQASYTLPESLQIVGGMCSVASSSEHLFLLGSGCASEQNELHLIQYQEDANKIQTR